MKIVIDQDKMIENELNLLEWSILYIISKAEILFNLEFVNNCSFYKIDRKKMLYFLRIFDIKEERIGIFLKKLSNKGFLIYLNQNSIDYVLLSDKGKHLFFDENKAIEFIKKNEINIKIENKENEALKNNLWIEKFINFIGKKQNSVYQKKIYFESVLINLSSKYGENEVREILRWAVQHKFWKNMVFDPQSISNNYEKMKMQWGNDIKKKPIVNKEKKVKKMVDAYRKIQKAEEYNA